MKEKIANDLLSESNESSRREFIKKVGKFAIYTPPAVMLLMHPSREAIARSPGKYKYKFKKYRKKGGWRPRKVVRRYRNLNR